MKTLQLDQVINPDWTITPDGLDDPDRYRYKVIKVTNSTTPRIWDLLTQEQVNLYCDDEEWGVTIK